MIPSFPSFKRSLPGVTTIIAVGSGKGGVGKTTTAVNLALALSQKGAAVGIFDADLYGPNVPLMLGVRRDVSRLGYIPVARADAQPYIEPLQRFRLKIMSIGLIMGSHDAVTPDPREGGNIIRQTLQDVKWEPLDYLVLDLPPGTGEPQQTLLRTVQIDGTVIVTTPQDLSLMDASRSIDLFRSAGTPILGLVENMSYLICPHCNEPVEVFHRSEKSWQPHKSEVPLLGRIPIDVNISRGIDANHPLLRTQTHSQHALPFLEIAEHVIASL